jgi:hypothetical protein
VIVPVINKHLRVFHEEEVVKPKRKPLADVQRAEKATRAKDKNERLQEFRDVKFSA